MQVPRNVRRQLKMLGASPAILSKAEARCLPQILHEDEKIEAFIYGTHPGGFGMMVASNKRLIFINKTMFGTKVDDVPYGVCQAIEYSLGIRWGKVTIFMPAKNFEFTFVRRHYVLPFVNYVEQRILLEQNRSRMYMQNVDLPTNHKPVTQRPALTQFKERLTGNTSSSTQRNY